MRRRNFIKSAFGLVAYAAMNLQMLRAEKSPAKQLPEADPEKVRVTLSEQGMKQFDKFIRDNYLITPYPVKGSRGDCLGVEKL